MNPTDPNEFNAKLAKLLQGLKKEGIARAVRQGYKGTGARSARRQIWVDFSDMVKPVPGSTHFAACTDIWLEGSSVEIGGVVAFTGFDATGPYRKASKSYANQTPETIYAWIVECLKSRC